jgi:hypothetical protein
MARWFTALALLLILTGGVLAGASVFASDGQMSEMDCCRRMRMDAQSASAAQLCCAVNCNDPVPTSTGSVFNLSPSAEVISDSVLSQIASLLKTERVVFNAKSSFEQKTLTTNFQPKYIQHHSFLI